MKSGLTDQLQNAPSMADLHQLLAQALEKRGKRLNISWRGRKSAKFTLNVICHFKGGDPQWTLFCDKAGQEPLFDYTSCDVLLVSNLLVSSCLDVERMPQGQTTRHAGQSAQPANQDQPAVELPPPRVVDPPQEPLPFSKTGDLTKTPVSDLLKKITENNITGKLDVVNDKLTATVFIQDGIPMDATASDAVGDDAMIELLTWKSGQYSFEARVLRNTHTVYQSMPALLEQSKLLSEHINDLKEAGMLPTSTLELQGKDLPARDRSMGSAVDRKTLENFYRCLDGKHSMEDMTRILDVSRIKLIHMIHYLVSNELVSISNQKAEKKTMVLQPRAIDTAAIQTVMMSLRRADTGMFIYPAFLYFLEQEYFRSYRDRGAFSVIVFELRTVNNSNGEVKRRPLPPDSVVEAVLRISELKRHVDLLAHYDTFDYALLLPNTKSAGSKTFGKRVIKSLLENPLAGQEAGKFSICMGAASVPEDFKDLSSLLGAADLAMTHARETEQSFVLYRDIKDRTSIP